MRSAVKQSFQDMGHVSLEYDPWCWPLWSSFRAKGNEAEKSFKEDLVTYRFKDLSPYLTSGLRSSRDDDRERRRPGSEAYLPHAGNISRLGIKLETK